MDWIDNVEAIDQETLDEGGPSHPWIQWVNGKPQNKQAGGVTYHGGWFIPQDNVTGDTMPNWQECTLFHEDGSETAGWCRRDLTFAVICWRRAWRVYVEGRSQLYPWNEYDKAKAFGNPSGKLQILVGLDGFEAPFVLTMSGTAGRAFMASRGASAMGDLGRYVIQSANKLSYKRGKKRRWAWRAFWLTVGPGDEFTTVGKPGKQSQVTPPMAVGLKDGMTAQEIGKLFVGGENLTKFSEWYADNEEWRHAWDSFDKVEPKDEEPEWQESTEDIPF